MLVIMCLVTIEKIGIYRDPPLACCGVIIRDVRVVPC